MVRGVAGNRGFPGWCNMIAGSSPYLISFRVNRHRCIDRRCILLSIDFRLGGLECLLLFDRRSVQAGKRRGRPPLWAVPSLPKASEF